MAQLYKLECMAKEKKVMHMYELVFNNCTCEFQNRNVHNYT